MEAGSKKRLKHLTGKKIKKKKLMEDAVIRLFSVSKLNHGENVIMDVLDKTGKALNCTTDNIYEFEYNGR